ncbi:MAG: MaoC/PaaZ C-terminal domain-containing protein, partial [Dehalococcoidia bacterium]
DTNPAYFDDTCSGGSVVPPLVTVTLEWPLIVEFRSRIAGATPDELRRGVHVIHSVNFHRLLRPGERVTTTGMIVAVEQRRAGAFVQTRLDTLDQAGRPVATTFNGSIFLGVAARGGNRRIDSPPDTPLISTAADPDDWSVRVPVAADAAHVYSECADIYNPIHTERGAALAAGLPGIILHGTATLALAAREIVNRECNGDPARLASLSCRFGAMVRPGSTIVVGGRRGPTSPEGRSIRYEVHTDQGQPAIRDGWARIRSSN